jgi:hypothetical protein
VQKTGVVLAILVAVGAAAYQGFSQFRNAAEAYLFGYPLLLMAETEKQMLRDYAPNSLVHSRSLPTHESRVVVRPNNDTLYSTAWFDLSSDAWVLDVPAAADRYYVLPFMDAWTNVFASVGTRSNKHAASRYLLVGPDWQGDAPSDMEVLRSPTNRVWLIARVEIDKLDDLSELYSFQDQLRVFKLGQWPDGKAQSVFYNEGLAEGDELSPPELIVSLSPPAFFQALSDELATQALPIADESMLKKLASLGIQVNSAYKAGSVYEWLHQKAFETVRNKIQSAIEERQKTASGWSVNLDLGRYGTDYLQRAFVSLIGLGAMGAEDAVYPGLSRDSNGDLLHGNRRYRLHFPAGQTPPADAFWSLTVYDEDGYMVDNPIKRYRLGSNNQLHWNTDGSLDILFQTREPDARAANWLPIPDGNFAITLRIYQPGEALLSGEWTPPVIEVLN